VKDNECVELAGDDGCRCRYPTPATVYHAAEDDDVRRDRNREPSTTLTIKIVFTAQYLAVAAEM
jgi:hypothetical protein